MYFAKRLHARAIFSLLLLVSTTLVEYSHADSFSPGASRSGILLGSGYNSVRGTILADCVEPVETNNIIAQILRPNAQCNADGQCVEFEMQLIESSSILRSSLNIDAKATFGIGMFSGDIRTSFLNDNFRHHNSVFFSIKHDVTNIEQRLSRYHLAQEASDLIVRDPLEFYRRCGDQFVGAVTTGGQFIALLEIETTSEEDKKQLKIELSGSGLSWSAAGRIQSNLERISQNHTIHYKVYKNGSHSEVPETTPAAIIAAARIFPREVSINGGSPAIRFVTTMSYDAILSRPGGALPDLTAQGQVLDWLAQKRDEAFDQLKSIDTILQRPTEYENHDRNQMIALRSTYNSILETLTLAARVCAANSENCRMPEINWPSILLPNRERPVVVAPPPPRIPLAIQDIFFKCKKDRGCPANEGDIAWHPLDLNSHHDGKFIYCGYKINSREERPVKRVGYIATKDALHGNNLDHAMKACGFEAYNQQDLNEGAGGKFIYCGWTRQGTDQPITALDFVETNEKHPPQKPGWESIHQDLCEGAGGSFIWCYFQRYKP